MGKPFSIRPLGRGALAALLILCLAGLPAFAQQEPTDYELGKLQGELDARGKAIWILSGLLLGPIGIILPWVINPHVPGANLIGKSPEYVAGYMDGYRHKAKPKNFFYSLGGFAVWTAVVTLAIIGVANSSERAADSCGESCGNAFGKSLNESCSPSCSPQFSQR
jgi:hypothetical protein